MVKSKKKDSPVGTPIQTPLNTPDRPQADNSFLPLQSESEEEEERSVATITADDPPADIDDSVDQAPVASPEECKNASGSGPIAEILPTDLERLKESIPIFASDLSITASKLFEEPKTKESASPRPLSINMTQLKPPPAASLSSSAALRVNPPDRYANSLYFNSVKRFSQKTSPLSPNQDRSLADEIFGSDSKPPAIANNASIAKEATQGSDAVPVENNDPIQAPAAAPVTKIDAVDRLNQEIEAKQEQLLKLQQSIAALTQPESSPQMDVEMTDSSFILVQHKQPSTSPPKKSPIQSTVTQQSTGPAGTTTSSHPSTSETQRSDTRDPLTELARRRPIYPQLPEPTPKRPFFQRATWRIDIPKITESPEKSLIEGINEIWSILKEADDKLLIYPWKARNFGRYKALSGPSKLPLTKEGINRYFPDAYFRPHPGSMWLRVYIRSVLSDEELGSRTHYFFGTQKNKKRVGFWKNGIQFEDTIEIGWLYRSTPGMSAQSIQKELFLHTGIHTSLRWRLVTIPQLKGEIPENLQVRALHITVRKEDGNLAKAKFTKLVFARHRRSHFIGGSPMRLIPISRDLSLHNQDKCLHFAGRQLTFLKSIVVCESFDILQIDNKAIGLQGRTLRDLILEIPLRDSGRQTFLSVDRTFNGSSVKLVCYEKHQSECRNRLATLLPFLIFTNPTLEKGIRGCFSADANERALGVKWDDKRKEVVTVDDEILEGFDDWESDDDTDNQSQDGNQFMIDVAAATGLSLNKKPKKKLKPTKVREVDAGSIFSQSTIQSRNDGESEEDSDDTPKTINRSTPTAQTEAISSLSEGPSSDIKNYLDQMTMALMQLTTMIPNTPENQAALANIRAILPMSQRAGSSSDSQDLGSSGSGALPR
jgi:hypothetical protein